MSRKYGQVSVGWQQVRRKWSESFSEVSKKNEVLKLAMEQAAPGGLMQGWCVLSFAGMHQTSPATQGKASPGGTFSLSAGSVVLRWVVFLPRLVCLQEGGLLLHLVV